MIFDWDGTLVDSVEHIAESLHAAATGLGYPARPKEAYRNIIGLGMVEALRALYPELSMAEMQEIREGYSRYFFSRPTTPQQIFSGMTQLLTDLGAAGRGRAVATGKSRRGLDAALQTSGLFSHFDVTRCADETRSKPDPKMLEEILRHYDIDPAQAVMIGDTTFDLEMAGRIGMPRIGVNWGAHDVESLAQHEPQAIVTTVDELRRALAL